jgi:nitroreductase
MSADEKGASLRDLVLKNRSYRRFHQNSPISQAQLRDLVDLGRLSASGANRQALKYVLSWEPEKNARIFPTLAWAGYLKDWDGPSEGERPSAYIIMLGDSDIAKSVGCDQGIAAQSIMLGAAERGLGGCMIGSIEREQLRSALNIPPRFEILLVLALGRPKETVMLETAKDGKIEYWRDEKSRHHVPKRALSEIILNL